MEIIRSVETSRPLDRVFTYLSDFTTTNEWDPGTVETIRTSGNGAVGTTYHNVSRFAGRRTELDYVVTALEPDRLLVLRGTNRTVSATDTMTFEPLADGGTRVTYRAAFEFRGLAGRFAPVLRLLLGPAFKKLGDQAERSMRTALDRL